jgi:hypothetical protein
MSDNSGNPPNFEFEALRQAENYRHALVREFSPHLRGRVIEIGAGIGQITELLRKHSAIEHLLSVEPDAGFCREFRKTFPEQPLIEGTVDSITDDKPWNGIVNINVLEHILEDERELAIYSKLLRPANGRLCLFVPARQEIYAPIDRDFGHHRRYTKPGLKKKLEAAGFEVERIRYFNWVGYFGWWLNFRVMGARKMNPTTVRLFDRVIFPVVYATESYICAPPFGQSLIVIARAK